MCHSYSLLRAFWSKHYFLFHRHFKTVISYLCLTMLISFGGIRGFVKGRAPGKLTGCEQDLAMTLPGCFLLLFLLPFMRKTKNAWLKNPTDLLTKNVMKPLGDRSNLALMTQLQVLHNKSAGIILDLPPCVSATEVLDKLGLTLLARRCAEHRAICYV